MYKATIQVHTSINATHRWPDAKGKREYLSYPHMHTFHITAHARVSHNDRDIEFHDLRDQLVGEVEGMIWLRMSTKEPPTFGAMSCEAIGQVLLERLPDAVFKVQVMEDEDCGATVERDE